MQEKGNIFFRHWIFMTDLLTYQKLKKGRGWCYVAEDDHCYNQDKNKPPVLYLKCLDSFCGAKAIIRNEMLSVMVRFLFYFSIHHNQVSRLRVGVWQDFMFFCFTRAWLVRPNFRHFFLIIAKLLNSHNRQ